MTHLCGKGLDDFFRVAGPFVHGLVWGFARHNGYGRRPGWNATLLSQGSPRRVFFVFSNTEGEFTWMTEGGSIELSRYTAKHVNEHEANGATNAGIGPIAIAQDIMGRVEPYTPPNRSVDHDKLGTATGARRAAVQVELWLTHGFDNGGDDGHIGRQTARHHRIDGDLLRGNRTLAD